MNPFVNPEKRSVQLPNISKDLIHVLQGSKQAKCAYCGAPAVAFSIRGIEDELGNFRLIVACPPAEAFSIRGIEVYRWCKECQQDLLDFAAIEVAVQHSKVDFNNVDAVSRYRAEMQHRQDDFMRQRLEERKRK